MELIWRSWGDDDGTFFFFFPQSPLTLPRDLSGLKMVWLCYAIERKYE